MEGVIVFLRAALPWLSVGLLYAILFAIRAGMKKKEAQIADCSAEGMSLGIGLGLCLEVPFGNNSGIGIAIGMLIGMAIGICIRRNSCAAAGDKA
ncbi:MAG: hypothetical protein ACI4PG_09920 [Candidatus Ventricola sp.]